MSVTEPSSLPPTGKDGSKSFPLGGELLASVVVFLVALPLCMGVAIASGVPPALGLVTGIIGGLIVGIFAGQPLQVSGPAAGLAVMVWQLVEQFGLVGLGLSVFICGIIQIIASIAGLGRWFRAVSPAVIQGMLAGIGVIIFASQFHVLIDDKPTGSGLKDLFMIPTSFLKAVSGSDGSIHQTAGAVGLMALLAIVGWSKFKPKKLSVLPAPLVGVVVAIIATTVLSLNASKVEVPENMAEALNLIWEVPDAMGFLTNGSFWIATVGLALIASAETLLCATAVDRLHDGQRTDYKKELLSQGIGNVACGLLGALPVCGVIVRSSANVEAGGKTRASAIMHGAWILLLVIIFPSVLAFIPKAALAAILVYTGIKLFNFPAAKALAKKGKWEIAIWATTVVMIVTTNLLIGVVAGFMLALYRLLYDFSHLDVAIKNEGNRYDVMLEGAATFMSLPKIAAALESIPDGSEVHVHLDNMSYVDHACIELIEDWHERHPGEVILETDRLVQTPRGSTLGTAS